MVAVVLNVAPTDGYYRKDDDLGAHSKGSLRKQYEIDRLKPGRPTNALDLAGGTIDFTTPFMKYVWSRNPFPTVSNVYLLSVC